jgi:hypothetical protein
MADYIKFRLAAARVGATMAFLALVAGLAERARAASPPERTANFLREASSPLGNINTTLVLKLDSALAKLEHKLETSFTTTHKLNQTFLKIRSANSEFLKLKTADSTFLKIDDANSKFLKIDDANTSFLKIDDANTQFLKLGATAANSGELGGLTPDAFFQGSGHVITGSLSAIGTTSGPGSQLLSLPGGIIVVFIVNVPAAPPELVIQNNTGTALESEEDGFGVRPIGATGTTAIPFPAMSNNGSQIHLQIFPAGNLPDVVTIIASVENVGGPLSAVGQAFAGVPS